HVGRELGLQPGVVGQVALGLLDEAVELVEARARGVGVAGGVAGGHGAVGARADAEVEVGGGRLIYGAAGVGDAHAASGQVRVAAAAAAAQRAAGGTEHGVCADGDVGEGQGLGGLLGALGPAAVVAHRERAAHDAAGGVLVLVLEGEEVAAGRVDQRLPAAQVAADAHRHA